MLRFNRNDSALNFPATGIYTFGYSYSSDGNTTFKKKHKLFFLLISYKEIINARENRNKVKIKHIGQKIIFPNR